MALDSLKTEVSSYSDKKDAERREREEFQVEYDQISDAGSAMENLDDSIRQANDALQSRYRDVNDDLDRKREELERDRQGLYNKVSDALQANGGAKGKLNALCEKGGKYGRHAENARNLSEKNDRELREMIRQLGGDGAGALNGGGSGGMGGMDVPSGGGFGDTGDMGDTGVWDGGGDRTGNSAGLPLEAYTKKDDNGVSFMTEDGQLRPNFSYTCNGYTYSTDENGLITSWSGYGTYIIDADRQRDVEAQLLCGGEDRLPGDQGSHLAAIMNGGAPGPENQIPLRGTINQGDYKKSEGHVTKALLNAQKVRQWGSVLREDPSTTRPTGVIFNYSYGDIHRELTVDNIEGSTKLLDTKIKNLISEKDYKKISKKINKIRKLNHDVSVTSVLVDADAAGNIRSVTVGYRDETQARIDHALKTQNKGGKYSSAKYYQTFGGK